MLMVGNTIQEIFGNLPDEETLRQEAPGEAALTNLHIHLPPNFGSIASVDEAIDKAKAEEIAVLGTCNYYDHTIYKQFARSAVEAGITPVFGIEVLTMDEELRRTGILVNDPKNPGKFYICGKGLTRFDRLDDDVWPIWEKIREGDRTRIEAMIAKLNAIDALKHKGVRLVYQDIVQQISREKQLAADTIFLQERHLAQALQQALFETVAVGERERFLQGLYQVDGPVVTDDVVKVQNELRTYLLKQGKVAYVDECYISPEEAAELIVGLGGYVSYPILIDGAPTISPFEGPAETLVEHLLERQIGATEFIPTRNDLVTLTQHVKTLREHGFVVGAGTEHNDAIWLPLLPACKQRKALSDELLQYFWEGACVAVAHQYLCAQGRQGFRFLPDRLERKTQIEEMSELGARIVKRLQNS